MDKIELHQLCGYLPYGLKMAHPAITITVESYYYIQGELMIKATNGSNWVVNGSEQLKPILRPMSDLHKVSLKWREIAMQHSVCNNDAYMVMKAFHQTQTISLNMANWLYMNHFDIHNLIGRSLAIDLNTLNTK